MKKVLKYSLIFIFGFVVTLFSDVLDKLDLLHPMNITISVIIAMIISISFGIGYYYKEKNKDR